VTWSNLTTSATPFYEFYDPQATNSRIVTTGCGDKIQMNQCAGGLTRAHLILQKVQSHRFAERRIYPAANKPDAYLPDESGVPRGRGRINAAFRRSPGCASDGPQNAFWKLTRPGHRRKFISSSLIVRSWTSAK